MSSDQGRVYVWVWLPGAIEPVVAGALDQADGIVSFTYGQSYLARDEAISLYVPELPLGRGPIRPAPGTIAGCIADAGPDAWGMRVVLARLVGRDADDVDQLGQLTYLIESGSDRIGALDFQRSADRYAARGSGSATLKELTEATDRVQNNEPLSPDLDQALLHGSSIGGARPKAVLHDGDRNLIAKYSSTTDIYPVVKGEFISMELAARAGLDVASVELTQSLERDVLLVERFDRAPGGARHAMVSALTMLGLDEVGGRYASYADLADVIRGRFVSPDATLRELFSRITFNILTGNNDDHARNHAAFWNGFDLSLTPAYDISPQPRTGGAQRQLMAIGRDGWRSSQVAGCVERADVYHLTPADARQIVDHQIEVIEREWSDVCDLARLAGGEREYFWHRQYLNPYALEGYLSTTSTSTTRLNPGG